MAVTIRFPSARHLALFLLQLADSWDGGDPPNVEELDYRTVVLGGAYAGFEHVARDYGGVRVKTTEAL